MITNDLNNILGISESYQAPQKVLDIVLGDEDTRNKIYDSLARYFKYDYSRDWFFEYFEEEHADRKNNKQDFTPPSLARLVSKIIHSDSLEGVHYEPSAGTGQMIILNWEDVRKKYHPFDYLPNSHLVVAQELSQKTIPFLLLNMSIRGMSGIAIHGNTLTQEIKAAYLVINEKNSIASYSKVIQIEIENDVEVIGNATITQQSLF